MVGSYFSKIFGKSPVHPIQQHMYSVHQGVKLLVPFFEAIANDDFDKANEIQDELVKVEVETSKLKKEIQLNLPKGLFMPVDRRDLLAVLKSQDKLINKAKDITGLVRGRQMKFPEELHLKMVEYIQTSIESSKQAVKTVNQLDELVDTGFIGNEVEFVQESIHELDEWENKNDKIQVEIRSKLFELEPHLNPVDVIFTYKIIEWIGDLADLAQRVGNRLQVVLAK